MTKDSKISKKREKFNEKYEGLTDNEILKEILYSELIQEEKLEKIRANTSNLVWFLIVIPIIIGILFGVIGTN